MNDWRASEVGGFPFFPQHFQLTATVFLCALS